MADLPTPPHPAAAGRALKGKLTGHPPWVYALLAAGVLVAAYMIRRSQAAATVPSTDPTIPVGTPDAAVGSFQGYDTPQDNNITGPDLLDFILAVREQNIALTPLPDPVVQPAGGPTGGGLPDQPFPNPPPPAITPAPRQPTAPAPCPKGFPKRSERGCYKDCGHDECRGHKLVRNHGHCYPDGRRITVSIEDKGKRC